MSEMAKTARAAMREKAARLARGDPHAKVDGSDFVEGEPLNGNVQTGMRVIRTPKKRGGSVVKVEGEHAHHHAGKRPRRASGGRLADDFINRDVREANKSREGEKHDGGFARGGSPARDRAHKMVGGPMASNVPTQRMQFQNGPSLMSRAAGLKTGGKAKHSDEAEDKALIKKMVKPAAIRHADDCPCHECHGGRPERAHGGRADHHWIKDAVKHPGALHRELHVPMGKDIPTGKLHKAEHSSNKLVAKRAHLAETLKGMHHDVKESHGGRIARKSGGKAGKGKMNVNIIIGGHDQGQAPMAGAPPQPPMPPKAVPMPMPAPAPQMPMGMPMGGAMPPGMGMPPPPGGMPPQMPRKHGGSAYPIEDGSGGGEGRLEKIEAYGRK